MKFFHSKQEGLAYRKGAKANLFLLGLGLALPVIMQLGFSGYWHYRKNLSFWHEGIAGGCVGCHSPLTSSAGHLNCIRCHSDKIYETAHEKEIRGAGCTSCHPEHNRHISRQLRPVSNSACISCHPKILERVEKGGRLVDEKLLGSHVRRSIFSHESEGHCKRPCDHCHEFKPKPGEKIGPPKESIFSMQACAHCHENLKQERIKFKKRIKDVDALQAGKKIDPLAELELSFYLEDLEGEALNKQLDKLRRNASEELSEIKKQMKKENNHPADNCVKCHKYHETLANAYYPVPAPSKACTPGKL